MPTADGNDPRLELMAKIAKLESKSAEQVDDTEAEWMAVVHKVVDRWRNSWRGLPSTPKLNAEVIDKFRVCFPLAAHALNHIEAAVYFQSSSVWVAVSSARIAFEHALTAQWVLWTEGGENQLSEQMSLEDRKRSIEFVDAVKQAAEEDASLTESAALAEEFREFIGKKPSQGWSVFNLCERFSATRLLYGIYRDLSQAVHPSSGLVRAHFDITPPPNVVVGEINPAGSGLESIELVRAMAVSSLWAIYALEVSKDGHPDAGGVLRLGQEAGLPVDLRASDLRPHLQPVFHSVFVPQGPRCT